MIADPAGNFFGTTQAGGIFSDGSVYEIPAGTNTIKTLASFNGTNGVNPNGDLIADADDNLFGTTITNSAIGVPLPGTAFEVASGSNSITTLQMFLGTDEFFPNAGFVADGSGNLYGTSSQGGNGGGTVYELSNAGFVVPDPSSMALLSLGSLILLRQRRRVSANLH